MSNGKKLPTRFAVLKGMNGSFFGRDLSKIFTDGHLYQIIDIDGQHLIKDLGEHYLPDDYDSTINLSSFKKGEILFTETEFKSF